MQKEKDYAHSGYKHVTNINVQNIYEFQKFDLD